MSVFMVYTGGFLVRWAPTFATRAEAQAWIEEHADSWEERTEIMEWEGTL